MDMLCRLPPPELLATFTDISGNKLEVFRDFGEFQVRINNAIQSESQQGQLWRISENIGVYWKYDKRSFTQEMVRWNDLPENGATLKDVRRRCREAGTHVVLLRSELEELLRMIDQPAPEAA